MNTEEAYIILRVGRLDEDVKLFVAWAGLNLGGGIIWVVELFMGRWENDAYA